MLAAGVPWASILGNHDGEADLGRREAAAVDALLGSAGQHPSPLSLTLPGPANISGGGNFWIDLLAPQPGGQAGNAAEAAVVGRIWMLDSGNRGCGRLAWGW